MNNYLFFSFLFIQFCSFSQSYAPAAGEAGSTAIHMSDQVFSGWATGIEVVRGFVQIEDTSFVAGGSNRSSFGLPSNALGPATGNSANVVSLGDRGIATLTFDQPVMNGAGFDFAVFENSFDDSFLELAHVEVSSDGERFIRFPSHTEVQSMVQIHGFGSTDPRRLNNFAGKYRGGYGTPFDLDELKDSSGLNINSITHIRIIDAVGSVGDSATYDQFGTKVNDPFPTPYESGGFDLEAVGVINAVASSFDTYNTGFTIFPNPATKLLRIETDHSTVFKIFVINSVGKVVLEASNLDMIPLDLPSGIYVVKFYQNGYFSSQKLVIE